MDYSYCNPEDIDLATVAARFCCANGAADIINATDAAPWMNQDLAPPDGTLLRIPDPSPTAPCNQLPHGAQWMSWTAPSDDRLASLLMTLQRGPADSARPLPQPGRLVDGDIVEAARRVWYYYGNKDTRRACLRADTLGDVGFADATIKAGTFLMVPVYPPTRIEACVAPSDPGSSAVGGTVDVDAGREYAELFQKLHDLEKTIDNAAELRATIMGYCVAGKKLVDGFVDLRKSMLDGVTKCVDLPVDDSAYNDVVYQTDAVRRERVIAKMDALLGAAQPAIFSQQPAWQRLPGTATIVTQLNTALQGVKTKIGDSRLLALLVELFPSGYALPVSTVKRVPTHLATYVCLLAARAASVLDDKLSPSDLEILVRSESKAGASSKTLIEYGCACMLGFEGVDAPMASPSPSSLFGVVLALYLAQPLADAAMGVESAGDGSQVAALKSVTHLVLGKFAPLVKLATGEDWDNDRLAKEFKEKIVPFDMILTGLHGAQSAGAKIEQTKDAAKKLDSILSPFKEEVGVLRELVPNRFRQLSKVIGPCLDLAEVASSLVGSYQSEVGHYDTRTQGYTDALTLAKSSTKAAKSLGAAIKGIGFVANPAKLAALDATIEMLGTWSTVLDIAVDGCKFFENVDTSDASFTSKLALGGSLSTLGGDILFACATAGGPVCVVLGGALLTAGFLMAHRDVLVSELQGDTVAKFNALTEDPQRVAQTWAVACGFSTPWNDFVTSFADAKGVFSTPKKLGEDVAAVGWAAVQAVGSLPEGPAAP